MPKNLITIPIAVVIAGIAIAIAIFVWLSGYANNNGTTFFVNGARGNNSLTIISVSGGSLIEGSKYIISPDPFTGKGSYTILDGGNDDQNPAGGIVVIDGVREGRFTVTQSEVQGGYNRDMLSKIVEISATAGSATATFSSSPTGMSSNESSPTIKDIVYTAKFECGTVRGNEGPLRPGHYDTDIGIFNKQEFPVKITWLAATNDGKITNAILRTLTPQSSIGVVCKDLLRTFGNVSFTEGFVLIQVPLDPSIIGTLSGSGTTVIGRTSGGDINLLDVQVFYTANALDELPRSILIDKITFVILNDTSGQIPQSMFGKILDISVPSNMSKISDPEAEVKQQLAKQYSLTDQEIAGLYMEIKSIDVGVGTMIDDHAVSLSRLMPQASS